MMMPPIHVVRRLDLAVTSTALNSLRFSGANFVTHILKSFERSILSQRTIALFIIIRRIADAAATRPGEPRDRRSVFTLVTSTAGRP
jgi:hypothetical protein